MTTYFDLPLSKKLASLGISSESGMVYWRHGDGNNELLRENEEPRNCRCRKEKYPAYQMSDVFHKEALEIITENQENPYYTWKTIRDRMIEIYSEEGIEGLEKYLLENL